MAEIADVQKDHPVLMVVRDKAGENTSKELNDYFTKCGVKNDFSTSYEQWQNGLAEASVGSVTMLGNSVMAESGLGGPFWFCASTHGLNCRNVTFKERLGTTPHERMSGVKKDVSNLRQVGCRVYMHLNKERRAKGRGAPKAVEAVNLGLATNLNTREYKLLTEETGKILISNQVRFDETLFPYHNKNLKRVGYVGYRDIGSGRNKMGEVLPLNRPE